MVGRKHYESSRGGFLNPFAYKWVNSTLDLTNKSDKRINLKVWVAQPDPAC